MKAMVAYLKWVGSDVPKGVKPKGSEIPEIKLLDRPADPVRGKEYLLNQMPAMPWARRTGCVQGQCLSLSPIVGCACLQCECRHVPAIENSRICEVQYAF